MCTRIRVRVPKESFQCKLQHIKSCVAFIPLRCVYSQRTALRITATGGGGGGGTFLRVRNASN